MVANTTIEEVIQMLFLAFNKIKINFVNWKLNWRTYTSDEALPMMTKQGEIVNQKEFAITGLALENEALIVHIAYLEFKILIYLA